MPEAPRDFTLTLEPSGRRIVAPGGQSLLQAGLHAGIRLPSSCRNGTCRACMCQLLRGVVRYSVEWPGLSAEELRDGCLLPCVAMPLSDVVMAQVPIGVDTGG